MKWNIVVAMQWFHAIGFIQMQINMSNQIFVLQISDLIATVIQQLYCNKCMKNEAAFFHTEFYIKHTKRWDKVFKNRPSEICGRQPLKN